MSTLSSNCFYNSLDNVQLKKIQTWTYLRNSFKNFGRTQPFYVFYSYLFYDFLQIQIQKWETQSGSHLFNYLTISKTFAKSSNLQSAVNDILNLEVPSGTVGGRIAGM